MLGLKPRVACLFSIRSQVPVPVLTQGGVLQLQQQDDVGKLGHRLGAEPRPS